MIEVPVSWGELVDKITILEIKNERITDADKRANVATELELLRGRLAGVRLDDAVRATTAALKRVNEELWDIEDEIRDQERAGTFGARFIELARAVYRTNDRRMDLKRAINVALGSAIHEEKSYQPY
ncbi:hypothetical protein EYW49_19950 [Siculibacillus lacustris]|uniref:Uncharacterized protein n=1 Tax=Siculibacillus lacustris TaxID=1549641 RepID=A0A4V2KSM8_9HYPH|nr:DUF6165 family protein [Siculibacillus lacustris]TBW33558.1 hypothetical protein EYW49_19950 [Siculibacillus lacustris]